MGIDHVEAIIIVVDEIVSCHADDIRGRKRRRVDEDERLEGTVGD